MAKERIEQQKATLKATLGTLTKEKEALLQQQAEVNKEIENTRLELKKVALQLDKTVIKAVQDGSIFQMTLRNAGQTVREGDKLFTLVPSDAPLEIKAAVVPEDKNYLKEGAEVYMRVSACPYPDYGTLKGKVTHIAQDTTKPQGDETKAISPTGNFYEVTITPESLSIGQKNNQCAIELGLEGNVDIIAKEETVLSFFLRKTRLIADF